MAVEPSRTPAPDIGELPQCPETVAVENGPPNPRIISAGCAILRRAQQRSPVCFHGERLALSL